MISSDLIEMITPSLKIYLDKNDYRYIEDMFSECYMINIDGLDRVCLKPTPKSGDICMRFFALNGAFDSDDYWEDVKKKGTLL